MSDLPQQDTVDQYVGDGIEDIYNYKYLVPTDPDIDVFVTPIGQQANDDADIKILNVDYTVQGAGVLEGGTVTFLPGFIPENGEIVTLSRGVEVSSDTNYNDAKTIVGKNLDNDFLRSTLTVQQNQTNIDSRSLRYQTSSFLPDTDNKNIMPTLDAGYIWIGSPSGGVAAAFLDEDPDSSTLRSELASEVQSSDGAGLVGFFDENTLTSTTVRDNLNKINTFLFNQVEFAQTGDTKWSWNPNPPEGGWIPGSGTIGSALSGSDYSNANSQDLYEFFWDTFSDVICPVIGGRGPNAEFDFLANKPLTQPPSDGRTLVAPGPYTVGETFGTVEHTLIESEIPSHGHLPPAGIGYVTSGPSGGSIEGGVNEHRVDQVLSQTAGGDQPHENRQPSVCSNFYVKL